ncbi:transporter [Christiangramia fulva]|uniref:Transporter n=1 Tax=Christiangramia fulva TaxID=2126553 RepID=A0A2R3Z6U8_9FLAO|nr:TolC family protein [Christiangramia fulva]AVR46006.1 transporter [Christiangramia fulva]
MRHINPFLVIPALLFTWFFQAQQVLPVKKEQVLEQVMEKNRKLNITKQEFLAAKADYHQTNAVFLPNISVSHTAMTTTNPLMAFGFKLNQESIVQSDFNPDLLNNPDRVNNFATKIEVEQPLLNFDAITQRSAAKKKMQATELQSLRTEDAIKMEVEKAYMQLQLAYKAVDVLENALKAARENLKLAENSFKQGYLQKSDVLAVRVRVGEVENKLQYAKSNVNNASDYLSFLMDGKQGILLKPTDTLSITTLPEEAPELSENRADIQAMYLAVQAREKMHLSDKLSFLPRLNAFGSYELYDNDLFQGSANGYIAGVSLSWDILKGTKRFGEMAKSKAEAEKSRLEYEQYVDQSKMEIARAKRALKDAENQLNLTSLALEQSRESLRIRRNRFEQGLEKTTELLMSESMVSQKELEFYQTVYEYNYALEYLKFLRKS